MMIQTKIQKLNALEFSIDKICRYPNREDIFLFDSFRLEMLQLSPDYTPIYRMSLKANLSIRQIDSVFFTHNALVIADSAEKKIFRLGSEWDENGRIVLHEADVFPLIPGSIIASATVLPDHYLLLDKGLSMLRLYNKDFQEVKTVGSRMGYILAYENRANPRLGFEFPEDMTARTDAVIVADSGNKRLVVINPNTWQLEKIIDLPEFPYKILAWKGDCIMVSDFDRSVMTVSLKYGFVDIRELEIPADFHPSACQPDCNSVLIGSESGELVKLNFPEIQLDSIAESAENWGVLMQIKLDRKEMDAAREIASTHRELLLDYAITTTDPDWELPLSDYISETLPKIKERIETLRKKIVSLSLEFIKKYIAIPESDDKEAVHIEKENIRHSMFLLIKEYRENLHKIIKMKSATTHYPQASSLIQHHLNDGYTNLKESLYSNIKEIKSNLSAYNELEMLMAIVRYWLDCEELQVVYRDKEFSYEKLFGDKFLLAILNEFYHHLAQLFLNHHKIEEYIRFSDRQLTMYPDKIDIAKRFVETLISLKKYDDAQRMLKKFPDQNKENVNYLFFRLYRDMGDLDSAYLHLKKELDLFPHRFQLIPQLIQLKKMETEEVDAYIKKILEKSGQGIDIYLETATAFQFIGDLKQARAYIEKELEVFPENQQAIAFKLNLLLSHPERAETRRLVKRLTSPSHSLIRSQVYYSIEDYESSWFHFKDYLRTNIIETAALSNIYLVSSLNYINLERSEIHHLQEIRNRFKTNVYKKEISVYLSFLKYFENQPIDIEVEKFSTESYLVAFSTHVRAYNYYLVQLNLLKREEKVDQFLQLIEKMLKYNPGNKTIFKVLENLIVEE